MSGFSFSGFEMENFWEIFAGEKVDAKNPDFLDYQEKRCKFQENVPD
jgi:hypothetical protein